MEDKSLSDKAGSMGIDYNIYYEKDVKEFINKTIDDIQGGFEGVELINKIKQRAGDKLIK